MDLAERAARLMKIVRLARNPMLDAVAIKLNAQPTSEEIRTAERWRAAFDLAAQQENDFVLAERLHKAHP